MVKDKAKDSWYMRMEINIVEIGLTIKGMAKEYINNTTKNIYYKVNGTKIVLFEEKFYMKMPFLMKVYF